MLSRLSDKCTLILLNKLKVEQSQSKYDLYKYGFEILISSLLILLSIPLYSTILFSLSEGIIFLLFFIPIRFFSGGYHASTYARCYICTMLFFFLTIFFSNAYPLDNIILVSILNISVGGYIILNAPVIHPNNPLTDAKIKRNKHRTKIFVIINIFSALIMFFIKISIATIITYTTLLVAVLMFIPLHKEGGKKYAK